MQKDRLFMKKIGILITSFCFCALLTCPLQADNVKSSPSDKLSSVKKSAENVKKSINDVIQHTTEKLAKSIEKGKERIMNVTRDKKSGPFAPEDFKFEEFNKIDLSQCKKLDVKEIKTNFERPIWFVKTEGTTINLSIKFRNEGERSFKDKPYLLNVLSGCINDSVGAWGLGGFNEKLKEHSVNLTFGFDEDSIVIDISCLVEKYDLALSFACELMTQALLPENSIERTKTEIIDNLMLDKVTPSAVAREKMSQLAAVKEYGWSLDAGLKAVPNYKREDIVNCYKSLFDTRNAEITIVGNLSAEQIANGINTVYESIKNRHNDFKSGPQCTELASQAKYEHYEIDNENTSILCALPGVSITDEDKYALKVANRVWGNNGLSSRLFVDIRERQHLVYTISSRFNVRDLQSNLEICAKTSPQYTKAVISGIAKNCQELAEKGITKEEFLADRIRVVASHVLHSPSAIMSYVLARRADGATAATVDSHLEKYAKLTVSDVNKTLKKVFDVNKMVVVSVGKTVSQVDKAQVRNEKNIEKSVLQDSIKSASENASHSVQHDPVVTERETKSAAVLAIDEAYLENGLRIVVCNMPVSKDAVFFGVGYYVGAADDPRDIVGASHFLEHMAFKESKNIPAGKMDRCLSTFNNYTNAFTCEDITFYTQHCNKAFLNADLRLESERMSNAKFLEPTVKSETNVILAERQMRTESDPYVKYIEEALFKDIYLYSNYSNGVIGYQDQIKNCTPEKLKQHYEKFYKPNNAVAIFVGDITIGEATELCQRNFGHIKRGEDVIHNRVIDPDDIEINRVVTYKNPQITQKRLGMVYKIPRKNISSLKQELVIEMINDMLFGNDSSIIKDKICTQLELVHNVRSYIQKCAYDFAFLSIDFDVNGADTQFNELEGKIEKTINNFLIGKSPTDIKTKFEKLKQSFKNRYFQMFDDPDALNWMLISNIMISKHSINDLKNIINVIDSITFEEFMLAAKELLNTKYKILVVHYEPSASK